MAQIIYWKDEESQKKLLSSYLQSGNLNFLIGAGASFGIIDVLGATENDINEALKNGDELEAYKMAHTFIANVIKGNNNYLDYVNSTGVALAKEKKTKDEEQARLSKIELCTQCFDNYKQFLENIDNILFERKTPILPRQANIFSTNYDMCIEYAAAKLKNIVLNDGFERSYGEGNEAIYRSEKFFDRVYRSDALFQKNAEIPIINLIKIHGSLSWRPEGREIYFDDKPMARFKRDLDPWLNEKDILNILRQLVVILPVMSKFHDTLFERVYYDAFRMLSKAMDAQNAVLISFGFSFNDEHILDVVTRALRNPTAQLIVFAFSKNDVDRLGSLFSAHRNISIMALENAHLDFKAFNSMIKMALGEFPSRLGARNG